MEDNIKLPIIFDFFGLPGCGKSTISHKVAGLLREKGYSVYESSYKLDHEKPTVLRRIIKIYQFFWINVRYPKKSKEIRELVECYEKKGKCLSQKINISTKLYALRHTEYDFLMFDEGVCQAAVSLGITSNIEAVETIYLKLTKSINNRILPIWLQLSVDTALERIKFREERNSRVEQQNNTKKQLELMSRFEKGCNDIGRYSAIEVNADLSVNKNAAEITNQIMDIIYGECR